MVASDGSLPFQLLFRYVSQGGVLTKTNNIHERNIMGCPCFFGCDISSSCLGGALIRVDVVSDCDLIIISNRVCAPGEDGEQFKLYQPVEHCFPLAVIHEHYTLKVVVRCLPRLEHIPFSPDGMKEHNITFSEQQVQLPGSVKTQESSIPKQTAMTRKIFSSASLTCPSIDDLSKRTAALYISPQQSSDDSNSTVAATTIRNINTENLSPTFPFSPPQPSPMSPKLLSGLADVLPYSRFQEAVSHEKSQTTETNCSHFQSFCFDTGCASHEAVHVRPHEEVPRLKPNQGRLTHQRRAESCSYPLSPSGVCPPSASSPIPFARKTANEKRRSLAINIKVHVHV